MLIQFLTKHTLVDPEMWIFKKNVLNMRLLDSPRETVHEVVGVPRYQVNGYVELWRLGNETYLINIPYHASSRIVETKYDDDENEFLFYTSNSVYTSKVYPRIKDIQSYNEVLRAKSLIDQSQEDF